jgi:peptide/nickel transport system permease protein
VSRTDDTTDPADVGVAPPRRADGGVRREADEPESRSRFGSVSEDEYTRRDQLERFLTEHVVTPASIVWSDWRARLGTLILSVYLLMGTVGVVVMPTPAINAGPRLSPPFHGGGPGSFSRPWMAVTETRLFGQTVPVPEFHYVLGTDIMGRDVLAGIVHATPPMLQMILAGAVFTIAVATVVGTVSGYKGGTLDRVVMTVTDVAMTIPGLPLIMVVAAILQPRNPVVVGLILSINAWAGLARALRSEVLALREESYVEASRAMGISTHTILRKDVIPNLMPFIMVNFVGAARGIIFGSVGLYFLGVLPFSSILNWGVMLNMAYQAGALYTPQMYHWLLIPLGVIVLFSFGLILFAQGTDRMFNPRVRARHAESGDADDEADTVKSVTGTNI